MTLLMRINKIARNIHFSVSPEYSMAYPKRQFGSGLLLPGESIMRCRTKRSNLITYFASHLSQNKQSKSDALDNSRFREQRQERYCFCSRLQYLRATAKIFGPQRRYYLGRGLSIYRLNSKCGRKWQYPDMAVRPGGSIRKLVLTVWGVQIGYAPKRNRSVRGVGKTTTLKRGGR